jgi:hypothetical protein
VSWGPDSSQRAHRRGPLASALRSASGSRKRGGQSRSWAALQRSQQRMVDRSIAQFGSVAALDVSLHSTEQVSSYFCISHCTVRTAKAR